jgi:signal transduction histidine kinase
VKGRTASRLAWSVLGLAFLLAVSGMMLGTLNRTVSRTLEDSLFVVVFTFMGLVGAMIAARLPRNAVGWLFLATSTSVGIAFLSDEYSRYALLTNPGELIGGVWAAWLSEWIWVALLAMPFTFLLLLFPDGHLPSRRWRSFARLVGLFVGFVAVTFALEPGELANFGVPNPIGVEALGGVAKFVDGPGFMILLALGLVSASSLVFRFRRAAGRERQQIKWFSFAAFVFMAFFLLDALREALGVRGGIWFNTVAPAVAFLSLPAGVGIAILRHRLYDVDLVINRTVVFGLLAAVITAIYLGIVVGIGALVGSGGSLPLSIAATAIIALAFQPLRARARRFADRLVYGKRATPYELLSELADRLGSVYSAEELVPRMARLVAEGTAARRAGVWLRVGDELRLTATWPTGEGEESVRKLEDGALPTFRNDVRAFPVRHQEELLGAITVTMPPRESLTPAQEKLISDLSAQAGLILRNVRLTEELKATIEELRASRQRIVAAQDEERRRLERNIHDGAQQQLVALAVKLRLAETLSERDPTKAKELIAQVKAETGEALENLRDLARGIYPPLLADKGLAAALEAQARKAAVPVEVETDGVGRYAQEAEAAVYFCVLEALQNIAKYAEATQATVRLRREDGDLAFEVEDDGRGFDPDVTPRGSGLQNMLDRLEALGGSVEIASRVGEGTKVRGRIPVGGPT